MNILITGVAGFIGSALALKLLAQNQSVLGIDNLNYYYDVNLKKNRLKRHQKNPNFTFLKVDIVNRKAITALFSEHHFDIVIHLAAQAGVRYSVENPDIYIDSNLVGFANVLEASRQKQIQHFIYSSSSSVYGNNKKIPFLESDPADHPLSLYAATKRANELMAHSYAHLYNLPCTALRFFTVYGPWGRPDMALFKFTHHILNEEPIPVFNNGNMMRDFTYIEDIIEGMSRIIMLPPSRHTINQYDPGVSHAPYQIYNIGNHQPIELMKYIKVLEDHLGKKAILDLLPMQAGDVISTYADINKVEKIIGQLPHTPIEEGVSHFVKWYQKYYA